MLWGKSFLAISGRSMVKPEEAVQKMEAMEEKMEAMEQQQRAGAFQEIKLEGKSAIMCMYIVPTCTIYHFALA